MILALDALIRAGAPTILPAGRTSIALVHTTCPKYLVFADDSDVPRCVAQLGQPQELEQLHGVLLRLASVSPDLVPVSYQPIRLRDDVALHVQGGLRGLPWFRLAGHVRNPEQWRAVARKASTALLDFESAVSRIPEWQRRVHPGDGLSRQLETCESQGVSFSAVARKWIEERAVILGALGEVDSHAQHGDFCLNNLLIDERARIIDFDEFAQTSMPLTDWVGLGLSLDELSNGNLRGGVAEAPIGRDSMHGVPFLPGFIVHFLLWRIAQAHQRVTRQRAKQLMIAKIEDLVRRSDAEIVSCLPRLS
jgi:hypothetical protein